MAWRHPYNKNLITSRFGVTANRTSPHRGLDYAPKEGTRIPAASKGTIQLSQRSDVLGWVVVQSAWDHAKSRTVYVGYSHLKEKSHLAIGTQIEIGQTVGAVGNTGSASRGAHLHLTIGSTIKSVFRGTVFDPEKFIDEQISGVKAPVCQCCKRPL